MSRAQQATLFAPVVILLLVMSALPFPAVSQTRAQGRAEQHGSRRPDIAAVESYCAEVDRFTKDNPQTKRVFANIASGINEKRDRWREFKSEEAREAAGTGDNLNDMANVWLKDRRVVVAHLTFQSPSRDWVHYVSYYFRADGTLAKIDAQLNTFYGRITAKRAKFYNVSGKLLRSTARYYRLGTTERVANPYAGPMEFIDEPIPLYKRVIALPFYHLIYKRRTR